MFELETSASFTSPLDQLTKQSRLAFISDSGYGLSAVDSGTQGTALAAVLNGSSYVTGGTTLIKGGVTTAAELSEVSNLLANERFNRDQITGNRNYTNYSYASSNAMASQSANEAYGFDRGDSLTNAFDVGTIVYRSNANVKGSIGFTNMNTHDKDDYFRFHLGKSGNVDISLTGLSQNAGLALYNSSGTMISFSDAADRSNESIKNNLSTGTYYARVYSYAEAPWSHGASDYTLNISRTPDALESYWSGLLVDASVKNAALNSIKFDSSLSREDVVGILKSAGDYGRVDSYELTDLRNFYNNAINTANVAADVKVLAGKTIFTDNSNAWYTGSDSLRDRLGNLSEGSSTSQLNLLIGKHFLGTDRPAIGRDSSDNLLGTYTRAGGSLFVNGASAADVNQGSTGTCYVLAALAGTANDKPSMISDMFRDNGDDTWSVRYYTNLITHKPPRPLDLARCKAYSSRPHWQSARSSPPARTVG